MTSPDQHACGFLDHVPVPVRYENASTDPGNVAAKLSALIGRGAKVLDVGCGTGSISEVIQKMAGAVVLGVEPDKERAAAAAARGLCVFQGYLTESLLREQGPFDVVVFSDVLEHLANPAEVVALAKQGLAPGGSVVASVPNVAHWFIRTDLLRGRFDYRDCGLMDATHLRWFTRKTIVRFFENLGFRITALDCTVNAELPEFRERAPWRWLSHRGRRKVVGVLVRSFPELFGCQHVVRATLKG